jgi:hypothetical protein
MRTVSLLSILLTACAAPSRSDGGAIVTRDSAGITIVEYPRAAVAGAPTWQLGDRLARVGGQDADEMHDMTGAEVGRLLDSSFVVGERSNMQLRRFTLSGALLGSGAGRGEGPGELLYLASLLRTDDGFAVVDPERGALVHYDTALQFRRQKDLRDLPGGVRMALLDVNAEGTLHARGGPWAFAPPSASGEITRTPEVVERIASGRVDTLFTVPGPETYQIGTGVRGRRFAMRPLVHRTPTGFWSSDGERWELAVRNDSGRVVRLIRLDWPRRPVTEPMRAEQLRLDHQEIDELPPGGFQGIRRMAELDFADPRFPDSLPPFDHSVLGPDGTLWLREGTAPTDTLQHWLVFGGDTLLGRLELPVGLTVLDARRTLMLLHRTDSLDVGYVDLRAISSRP